MLQISIIDTGWSFKIFSVISYVTHFYRCISCRVINVQNGKVTFAPPCTSINIPLYAA